MSEALAEALRGLQTYDCDGIPCHVPDEAILIRIDDVRAALAAYDAAPAPSDAYESALRDACDAVECFFDGLAQEDEWDIPQLKEAIMECARNDL